MIHLGMKSEFSVRSPNFIYGIFNQILALFFPKSTKIPTNPKSPASCFGLCTKYYNTRTNQNLQAYQVCNFNKIYLSYTLQTITKLKLGRDSQDSSNIPQKGCDALDLIKATDHQEKSSAI